MFIDFRRYKTIYLSFICILMFVAVLLSGMIPTSSSLVKSQTWLAFDEDGVKQSTAIAEGHVLGFEHNAFYSTGIDNIYQWHSFYGSSEREAGNAIALDSAGHIYLTGRSDAFWNGPGGENPINGHSGGNSNIVLTKIDAAGNFHWHTFYGTSDQNLGYSIAVDSSNSIYLAGLSNTAWNNHDGESPLNAHSDGDRDAVIVKVDSSGQYHWHSFYGAEGWNIGSAITVDQVDNLYLARSSALSWDGLDDKDPRNEHSGPPNRDITVIKANLDPPPQAGFLGSPTSGPVPLDVQLTDQSTRTPLGWAWYFGDEDLLNNNWTEKTGSAAWAGRYGHVAVALLD